MLLEPRFVWRETAAAATLEEMAKEHKVEDLITFAGAIEPEDVPEFLRELDVFLYPTFGDSYGYVVAEAMSMGLPVVATKVGSIPELVEDHVTGFLVRPHWKDPRGPLPKEPGGLPLITTDAENEVVVEEDVEVDVVEAGGAKKRQVVRRQVRRRLVEREEDAVHDQRRVRGRDGAAGAGPRHPHSAEAAVRR